MGGWHGRYLEVDLNLGRAVTRSWPEEWAERFVGGSGLAAWLLWQEVGPSLARLDPLDPACPLVFFTGPLTGSTVPGTARSVACALSPLTGIWGEANAGGNFGPALKGAGLDGLLIKGRAPGPCWLEVSEGTAVIHPADDLWGRDTYDTTTLLLARAPRGTLAGVACIGPAGERGAPLAAIIHNRGHAFGRTGMGAVMGSKNLKAVAVWGRAPGAAPSGLLREVRARMLDHIREHIITQSLSYAGTASSIDLSSLTGDLPVRNWTRPSWERAEAINASSYDSILVGKESCFGCPVGCKRRVRVEGPIWRAEGPGPEYETLAALGSLLEVDDLEAIAHANEICNRAGLDTISLGATLAMATELAEAGLLPAHLAGGLTLRWGDAGAMVQAVRQAAEGEGLGRWLAQGTRRLAAALLSDRPAPTGPECRSDRPAPTGLGSRPESDRVAPATAGAAVTAEAEALIREAAVHVKGLEVPMHDPRVNHGMGLAYATSYRGACHVSEINFFLEQGAATMPGLGLGEPLPGTSSEGKASVLVAAQDFTGLACNCLLFCYFVLTALDDSDVCQALEAVTGRPATVSGLREAGERVWMLKRLINVTRGVTRRDDALPPRLMRAFDEGPVAGSSPDMESMLDEFYRLRGLDETGRPLPETLVRLGLPPYPGSA
ncbi:MAG: aldehyde ferredoxin oxidoreductase family protein [Firmicutes bacterium]|nr:aldehyde ferredoxin oxidoreductase family protein [Bacillota bacterium]